MDAGRSSSSMMQQGPRNWKFAMVVEEILRVFLSLEAGPWTAVSPLNPKEPLVVCIGKEGGNRPGSP